MNWGLRLKELVARNWREKIISILLAFLFWFMMKAQDARHSQPYVPQQMKVTPSAIPAPPQLAPTLDPSTDVQPNLAPSLPPPPDVETTPPASSGAGIGKSTGL
ncbi:MAG: hypothetical protein U1F71_14135 [Verrucomicrobiaceae bacterium]